MRAGRLETRRIKVRRRFRRTLCVLLLLPLLAGGLWYLRGKEPAFFSLTPSPTLSPDEQATGEQVLELPGETWYALQLGVFSSEEAAKALADSYMTKGAASYIFSDGGSWRVLAAAYDTRAKAQAVSGRLKNEHAIETYIFELSRGGLTVKVRGQKAQLAALENAYACLSGAGTLLSGLSEGLDDYSRTLDETKEALASEEQTARVLREKLTALFSAPPDSVARVIAQLTALEGALQRARAQSSAALTGAYVKYAQLLALDGLSQYAALLSGAA